MNFNTVHPPSIPSRDSLPHSSTLPLTNHPRYLVHDRTIHAASPKLPHSLTRPQITLSTYLIAPDINIVCGSSDDVLDKGHNEDDDKETRGDVLPADGEELAWLVTLHILRERVLV